MFATGAGDETQVTDNPRGDAWLASAVRALLYAWSHPKRRAASQPRLSVATALANALLTVIGIYRY